MPNIRVAVVNPLTDEWVVYECSLEVKDKVIDAELMERFGAACLKFVEGEALALDKALLCTNTEEELIAARNRWRELHQEKK
jgi:hypothetical protein